jgi:hypothetical protein
MCLNRYRSACEFQRICSLAAARGVPVDFRSRYMLPIRTIDSMLGMSINGELVKSINLRSLG